MVAIERPFLSYVNLLREIDPQHAFGR